MSDLMNGVFAGQNFDWDIDKFHEHFDKIATSRLDKLICNIEKSVCVERSDGVQGYRITHRYIERDHVFWEDGVYDIINTKNNTYIKSMAKPCEHKVNHVNYVSINIVEKSGEIKPRQISFEAAIMIAADIANSTLCDSGYDMKECNQICPRTAVLGEILEQGYGYPVNNLEWTFRVRNLDHGSIINQIYKLTGIKCFMSANTDLDYIKSSIEQFKAQREDIDQLICDIDTVEGVILNLGDIEI